MSYEKILWTALPNGLKTVGGKTYLKVTLFVSPRLYSGTNTTLGSFPDFLKWPQRAAGLHFKFKFSPGPSAVAAIPDPGSPPLEEKLWEYLFTSSTFVKHYQFQDFSKRFIITNPVSDVNSFVENSYKTVISSSPNSLPSVAGRQEGGISLHQFFDKIQHVLDIKEVDKILSQYRDSGYGYTHHTFPPPAGNSLEALKQLSLFYYRPEDYHPAAGIPHKPQTLDFHEQVSSLSKYPDLLRRLGLAIDLLVPVSGVPVGNPNATIRVANKPVSASIDITPQTYFTLTSGDFFATSSSGEVKHGMLDLSLKDGSGNPVFELLQLDTDGAALKLIGMIRQILNMGQGIGIPTQVGLPALRSGGIWVIQNGRAVDLTALFPVMSSNNSMAEGGTGSSITLHAEDVTRGFRVDMWDSDSGHWHSLHLRGPALDPGNPGQPFPGSYEFIHAPSAERYFTPAEDDENFVSMGVTQDPTGSFTGGSSPDLYLHEGLWRWMGWSFAGSRPGKNLGTDDTGQAVDNTPGPGVGLVTRFAPAKGTLPKLRFGNQYRLRARVVDLAGNSVAHTSTDSSFELPASTDPPVKYRRFESIVAPATVLRKPLDASPGESTDRLVIRTDFNRTPTQESSYLNTLNVGTFYLDSQRHIAPPRMAQLMAEMHKLFDSMSPADSYNLITRYDSAFDSSTVEDVDSLPMPYLPELLSRGAAFVGLPGTAGAVYRRPFNHAPTQSWPVIQGFRVVLEDLPPGSPPKAPQWTPPGGTSANPIDGVLTVYLARGRVMPVQLSSFLSPVDLELMGIWGWMEDLAAAGKLPAGVTLGRLRNYAVEGQMWAITPFRELTLVNAIQRPLIQPVFSNTFESQRLPPSGALGETYSVLTDKPMRIDAPSTVKLNVEADWTMNQDDLVASPSPSHAGVPGPALPTLIRGHAHVVEIPIDALPVEFAFWSSSGGGQATVVFPAQTSAPSPGVEVDIAGMNPAGYNGTFKVLSSTTSSVTFSLATNPGGFVAGGTVLISEVRFYESDDRRHHFGDTKYRRVNYWATASTRFLEYFPQNKIATPPLTVTSASWSGGKAMLSFDAQPVAPGFGQKLVVSGMDPAGYNGAFTVLDSTTTSVTYSLASNPGAFVNGGTVVAGDIITTRTSPVKTVDVLSTARPDAPNVLYSVPTFAWNTAAAGSIVKSTRSGGWLRVYLDRPWFSSGDGELLGVILVNQLNAAPEKRRDKVTLYPGSRGLHKRDEQTGVPSELKSYVTQWGQDPLWASPQITAPPIIGNFPAAVASQSNLYLEELGGLSAASSGAPAVAVAGHTVHYDQARSLWYSDIQFDWSTKSGTSYFPFVRLALARYQPHSISYPDTVHLSRVILADFAQLTPDRVAQVLTHSNPKDPRFVELSVSGPTYSAAMNEFAPQAQIEVTVEHQMPGVPGELAWVPIPNSTYQLSQSLNAQDVGVWTVGFELPHPVGSVPFRLIIREHEMYPPEAGVQYSATKRGRAVSREPSVPRLVYAAVLQI